MREQLQNIPRSLKLPSLVKNEENWIERQDQGTLQKVIRPITDDRAAWDAYWQAQNQPWRTEPEISPERKVELEKCRAVVPDIEKGIYPFKGMKLDRADLEWLLSTMDSDPDSETWSDEKAKDHSGLDVRGADLQHADLHGLPLTQLRGGLKIDDWYKVNKEQGSMAVVLMGGTNLIEAQLKGADLSGAQLEGANLAGAQLEGANLAGTQLEGAYLNGAHLEKANLSEAHLEGAILNTAQLKGAYLNRAQLKGAYLNRAQLEGVNLSEAHLEKANLSEAHLEGVNLSEAHLEEAILNRAHLEGVILNRAQLKGAYLNRAQLKGADLSGVQLEGANLAGARLEGANLVGALLEGAYLNGAHLEGANLAGALLEGANLNGAHLEKANLRNIRLANQRDVGPQLADVQWGNTNLAVVDWSCVSMLGDEFEAIQGNTREGKRKDTSERLLEYQEAVRANRQLSVALQVQGLHEEAARFAYRAQRLQRTVLRRQQKFGSYLFSGFLDLIAGYGYRPVRSLIAYLVMIFFFMGLYLLNAHFVAPHLRWDEALVLSVSSFHGRGFFSQDISLGDTYARLAAAEAVVGLLIEISLIATFTQRFFGK
jgi:uncharacterized protein YjbI with pentapeptide repeats